MFWNVSPRYCFQSPFAVMKNLRLLQYRLDILPLKDNGCSTKESQELDKGKTGNWGNVLCTKSMTWGYEEKLSLDSLNSSHELCKCLFGLPLWVWAVVLRHFHITITTRTIEQGSWQCHVENHRVYQYKSFYCHLLCMEIVWLCAWFYAPVIMSVA